MTSLGSVKFLDDGTVSVHLPGNPWKACFYEAQSCDPRDPVWKQVRTCTRFLFSGMIGRLLASSDEKKFVDRAVMALQFLEMKPEVREIPGGGYDVSWVIGHGWLDNGVLKPWSRELVESESGWEFATLPAEPVFKCVSFVYFQSAFPMS